MRKQYFMGGPAVDLYDDIHRDTPLLRGDIEFYRKHARNPVLELGCGTGRVSIPLARAGLDVTGLDLSPRMLAVARAKAPEVRWVRGRMDRFNLRRRFGLILIPFRAFQHLLTPESQRACLERVRRHLAPGGTFIVHVFDPRLPMCVPGAPFKRSARVRCRGWKADAISRTNDAERQVLRETWEWKGPGGERALDELTLRWTYRWEMRHLLELSGLKPVALYGDFRGGRPRYGKEQVWVCTR